MQQNNYNQGIDVSHWQGEVDWYRVKEAGITFAVAKVTGGNDYQDPKFLVNWSGMKNSGIKSAAYHYFKGGHSPASQIMNIKESLLAKCDFDVYNDVFAIDVEERCNENVGPEQMADTLYGLLDGLNKTFDKLYIYCSNHYWENKVAWQKYDFGRYKLWIAHYTDNDVPRLPTTWQAQGWTFWQYSNHGVIPGIRGYVDLNRVRHV